MIQPLVKQFLGRAAVDQAPTSISLRLEAAAAAVGVVSSWVSTPSPRNLSLCGMCQAARLGEGSVLGYHPTPPSMETGQESWKTSCRKRRVEIVNMAE